MIPLASVVNAHLRGTSGISACQTFLLPLGVPSPKPILMVHTGLVRLGPASGDGSLDQIHDAGTLEQVIHYPSKSRSLRSRTF